ncbi:sugar phosphate isomerase/epimerase [candidate division KSB1 bacterium]|nr:sugar phosphate isomerase/epimerase [candidate division KSB1 bacterium]
MTVRVGLTVERYKGIEASFILALVKRFGLEYVEITKSVFKEIENIKPLVKNIRTGFHLPIICENNFDFSCPAYKEEIDELIELLNEHWKELNIKYFLAHPPEPAEAKEKIETSVSYLFENLNRLPHEIYIENVPTWSIEEFDRFYSQAKQALGKKLAGMCLDAPHFFIRGEDPVKQVDRYRNQIKCVHLSDCKNGRDLHLPFGTEGNLPIDEILNALESIHYNNYINLELMPRSFDDLPYIIYSYLKILRKFRPYKYFRTKIRTLIFLPFIRKLLAI